MPALVLMWWLVFEAERSSVQISTWSPSAPAQTTQLLGDPSRRSVARCT
jgi:hypothetical protein